MQKTWKELREKHPEELPREKCLRLGEGALTDTELLAVLLRTGTKDCSVLSLAEKVLNFRPAFDGLVGLMHFSISEYREIRGIGKTEAIELACIGEIARRIWKREKRVLRKHFARAEDIVEYYKEDLRTLSHEELHVMYLDHRMQLLRSCVLSVGSCSRTVASPREIFTKALRAEAICMVMVHNHPSGDPYPSREDRQFTKELYRAGQLIGITLLDHIIIGDNRYYSFKEQEEL